MHLKAVLFDLDDTLYDHQFGSRAALMALYEGYPCFQSIEFAELERQHSILLEHYHAYLLRGEMTLDQVRFARFRDLFARHNGSADSALVVEAQALYRETYYSAEQVVPGGITLLKRLRSAGLKIGVVTNNSLAEQTGKIQRCGLDHLIDALVVPEVVGVPKPDPRIFAAALDQLGCAADEAVMIGDSWTADIEGAQAAGIRAIWLNRYGRVCPDRALAVEIETLAAVLLLLISE